MIGENGFTFFTLQRNVSLQFFEERALITPIIRAQLRGGLIYEALELNTDGLIVMMLCGKVAFCVVDPKNLLTESDLLPDSESLLTRRIP